MNSNENYILEHCAIIPYLNTCVLTGSKKKENHSFQSLLFEEFGRGVGVCVVERTHKVRI